MSWITYQIISMVLTSINSIVDKRLVRDYQPTPIMYLGSFALVGSLVVGIGLWLVPWMGFKVAGLGLLSGLLFSGAVLLYYQAMDLEDVSRLIPVLKMSGVLKLALLALFLDDKLAWSQYLAFATMLMGTSALVWKTEQNRRSVRIRLMMNRGVAIMGMAALLLAFDGLISSHLNLDYSPWILIVWSQAGTVLGFCLALAFTSQRVEFRRGVGAISTALRWTIIGQQVLRLIISLLSSFAVHTAGSAAIASALGGMRPLLVIIMAVIFLEERFNRKEAIYKLAGVGCICAGTGLLFWQ